jgi:hypothetical protein
METRFNVGDRVRLTEASEANSNKVGDIGVITEISSSGYSFRVTVDGNPDIANWSAECELVPVSMRINDLSARHRARLLVQTSDYYGFEFALHCIDNNVEVFGTMPLSATSEGFDYWSDIVDEFKSGKYAK